MWGEWLLSCHSLLSLLIGLSGFVRFCAPRKGGVTVRHVKRR